MVKKQNESVTTYKVVSTETDQGNPNLTVAVRLRPESDKEKQGRWRKIIKILDEHVLVFDPADPIKTSLRASQLSSSQRGVPPNLRRKARDYKYAFDRVFDDDCAQSEVFEATTKPLIDSVLNGFNATVFCYGATGSGKTHTMIGSADAPGVMVLTMEDLFRRIEERKSERKSKISMSYLEIYNETIRDLLVDNSPPLMLCEDPLEGAVVQGLSEQNPASAEEVFQLLEYGNNNRRQSPTEANAQSSRSHAVLQITVNSKARTADVTAEKRIGKLSLIDLAGSERAAVTQNRGERLTEGANINKSLLALGNCINSLGENYKKGKHVPYRDSKLTRLLKDSLGGNCKTVMIANISPSSMSYEDTSNTLKYANRAKNIKTNVQENVVNVNYHITKYTQIIADLRAEVSELKSKLQQQNGNTADVVTESRLSAELFSQKAHSNKLESELAVMRKVVREQYFVLADYGLADDKVRTSYSNVMNSPPPPHKAKFAWNSVHNTPRGPTTPRQHSPNRSTNIPNYVPIQTTSPEQHHYSGGKHRNSSAKKYKHHNNNHFELDSPIFMRSGAEYYDEQIQLNDLSPTTPKGEKKQRPLSKKQKEEIQKGVLIKPKPILKKSEPALTLDDIENKKPVKSKPKRDENIKVEFIAMPKSIIYKAAAPKVEQRLSQPVPRLRAPEPLRRVSIATSKVTAKAPPKLSLGVKSTETKAKVGKSPAKKKAPTKNKENVKPKINEKFKCYL